MRKRLSWGAVLSLMIIVVAVTVCITMLVAMRLFNAQVNELSEREAMYRYVAEVDNAVRQNYYGTIDKEVLHRAMASGGVTGIGDSYARYLTPEEYSTWLETISGETSGFGLEVALDEGGHVVVSAVQKDSPAHISGGLQVGDHISALNKVELGVNALAEVQQALNTATSVILTVQKSGQEALAVELTAASFKRESVVYQLQGTVGYIRIKAITDAAPAQLRTAFASLKEQGASSLVLDLRNVDGGSSDAAKKMLSMLLPYGLYGYYQDNDGVTELKAEESVQLDVPTAVLVNKKTAGEAELMAAALRQVGRATLVGNTTAGRSRVQTCIPLASDNAAVYLTVGELQLLDKNGWEGKGFVPDVESSLTAEQEKALDLLTRAEDAQYQAAVKALSDVTEPPAPPTTTTTTTTTTTATETDATTTTAGVTE